RERPRRAERRRRPGDVRLRHDRYGGRAGRAPAVREQRAQVGERGYRAGDGLRHRAVCLPRAGRGRRAAVGRGARAVPARQGPVARGPLDRPSQRGHVPLLSGADPAPDGPCLPRRATESREPEAVGRERAAGRLGAGIHAGRDRDRHARRPRPTARAPAEGTSRHGGGRRRDRVRTGRRPGEDVRRAPLRDQGRYRGCPRRAAAPGVRGSAARRAPGLRRRCEEGCETVLRRLRHGRVRELRGGAVKINGVAIEDTFAEAFTMRVARLLITGRTLGWAREAAVKLTGFATSVIGCKCYWRLPVMEGEFLIEETFGMLKGVGGGNFLILARDADAALASAEAAVAAMTGLPGVILPFPGGVVRSGSKVGSQRYKN